MDRVFKIVVADDDLDDQQLVNAAFKDAKVQIVMTSVYNGLELLDYLLKRDKFKKLKDGPPDLILLDLNMPLMDGFEALETIKSTPVIQDIPVFVITTSKAEAEKQKALALGAAGFYHKGASSQDIKRIIKEVCFDCFA